MLDFPIFYTQWIQKNAMESGMENDMDCMIVWNNIKICKLNTKGLKVVGKLNIIFAWNHWF